MNSLPEPKLSCGSELEEQDPEEVVTLAQGSVFDEEDSGFDHCAVLGLAGDFCVEDPARCELD